MELPAAAEAPDTEFHSTTRRRLVWRALGSLGHLSREVILLKEIQGFTFAEIAAMLRLPIGTVKSRSNRARLELAERVLALDPDAAADPSL